MHEATITPTDNGPYLIHGNITLIDAEGPAGVFSDESQMTELLDLIDSFGPSTRIQ